MKQILIGALMVITSYGAQSQNLWKAPLLPEENLIEVKIEETPTEFETQMNVDTIPHHPMRFNHPLPPHAKRGEIGMRVPKPQQIIRKGNKVILIFDRNQFDKFRRWDLQRNRRKPGTGTESLKRVEHNSMQRGYLERKPNNQ